MSEKHSTRELLEDPKMVDQLAAIEHERWSHWQRYLHDQCELREDGALIIPARLVARWESQIVTPYEELSEEEQDSDKEQVHRYLRAIIEKLK